MKKQSQKEIYWTFEKVKVGFNLFYKQNNRYPTAREIDKFEFLPSSRQIQRSFGGLENLRIKIGLNITNYSKGKHRSNVAGNILSQSRIIERDFYYFLLKHFDEILIHEQKPIHPTNLRADYFIYKKGRSKNNFNKGTLIDIFSSGDIYNYKSIIRHKRKKYEGLGYDIVFISVFPSNSKIIQKDIYEANKSFQTEHTILPTNIRTFEFEYFKENIKDIIKI